MELMTGTNPATRQRTATFLVGLMSMAIVLLFHAYYSDPIDYLGAIASDLEIRVHGDTRATGNVVIAAIDERSIVRLGRWPWPRDIEGHLVETLKADNVAAIAFDMIFSDADSTGKDAAFARAMQRQGSTYIGYFFATQATPADSDLLNYKTQIIPPPPATYNLVTKENDADPQIPLAKAYLPPIDVLKEAARGSAFLNIDEDPDGSVRSYPTVIAFNGEYCAPEFLAIVNAYDANPGLRLYLNKNGVGDVSIGDRSVRADDLGRVGLRYRGAAGTIPRYSVSDILDRQIPTSAVAGKIVVVGATAAGLGDRFVTPMGSNFPGVEIQATAIDDALAGDFLYRSRATRLEEFWISCILGLATSLVAAYASLIFTTAFALALTGTYLAYSIWRLNAGVLAELALPWMIIAVTFLGATGYRYLSETREKRYLRSLFELYLSPEVIASLLDDPSILRLGGQRRHLSVLFADIVDFTARAEAAEPESLVSLLNTFMTSMTDVILENGGVVDKLMGDGIMAFWGAPVAIANTARPAVNCALCMREELKQLATYDSRFSDLDIGIGIATGEAIVGNMGGERRFDYSAVGDTVNLASRLEGLTRELGVAILVDNRTVEEGGPGILVRDIGPVQVKGRRQFVIAAEILGIASDWK
jgi:adenylate cyclase